MRMLPLFLFTLFLKRKLHDESGIMVSVLSFVGLFLRTLFVVHPYVKDISCVRFIF